MKTLIDRPDTTHIRTLDRMLVELSPHMREDEVDRVVEFMNTISQSQWDINPTVDESAAQIKLLIGSDRYEEVKVAWAKRNQHLIPEGRLKYIHLSTGVAYDGLDPEDNPDDYQQIKV